MTLPLPLGGRRVVVLGATGFIGRWVARAMAQAGAQVWLAARDRAAAAGVAADYGIAGTVAEVDVLRAGDLQALMSDARPHLTCNLAGYGVDRRETDAQLATAINLDLVSRLIEHVSAHVEPSWPGLSLLHAGSALEYGVVGGHLEEDGPTSATTVYGQTKLAARVSSRPRSSRAPCGPRLRGFSPCMDPANTMAVYCRRSAWRERQQPRSL